MPALTAALGASAARYKPLGTRLVGVADASNVARAVDNLAAAPAPAQPQYTIDGGRTIIQGVRRIVR